MGIDPGTTVGFAILDSEGKLIHANQEKHLDIDSLVSIVNKFGIPLLVGTDKAKVPGFVQEFSAKTGAKIIKPDEDMLVEKKKELAGNISLGSHSQDAFASAVFCYRKLAVLLNKVKSFASENNCLDKLDAMLALVVKQGLSRHVALQALGSKEDALLTVERTVSSKDYSKLLAKFSLLKQEHLLILSERDELCEEVAKLKERGKDSFIVRTQEPRLALRKSIFKLKKKYALLKRMALQNRLVAPVIKNLGMDEVQKVVGCEVIVVVAPEEFSHEALELIADKLIISKSKHRHSAITMINANDVRMIIVDSLAFIDRTSLKQALQSKDVIQRVVKEYKKLRT